MTDSVICFLVSWFWTYCLESAESCLEAIGLPQILVWWCCGKSNRPIWGVLAGAKLCRHDARVFLGCCQDVAMLAQCKSDHPQVCDILVSKYGSSSSFNVCLWDFLLPILLLKRWKLWGNYNCIRSMIWGIIMSVAQPKFTKFPKYELYTNDAWLIN